MKKILIINCGSSSMKFELFISNNKHFKSICKGVAEKIFIGGNLIFKYKNIKTERPIKMDNHEIAAATIINTLIDNSIIKSLSEISIIGHRIVHGGEYFHKSELVTPQILKKIKLCYTLAPLHNPPAVSGIEAFHKLSKKTKMTVTFDTSYHLTIPKENHIYPLNYDWYKIYNIRKYGAHGTSYRYIIHKLSEILKKNVEKINAIVCHLGNGASICSIKNGISYNTTMGLTPLGGLMMGTRSGDLDPSIIEYIANLLGINIHEVLKLLNRKSGILGVSGISPDFRDVLENANSGNKRCKLAIKLFVNKIVDYIVSYYNHLDNKVDAIIFTAGIGENSAYLRKKVITKLKLLKVSLDKEKNKEQYDYYKLISDTKSKVKVYCIRTNEEKIICQDALRIVHG